MKIKLHDIEPDEGNPFLNCKLGREQYASILTNIIATYSDGFVLAINNEWGTGKTTFVKMWQQLLKKEGYKTLYFNAWENDFDSSPLVAIISELKTLVTESNKRVYNSVLSKGAVLAKNIVPALVKSIAEKYIEIETLNDAIKNFAKGTTEILEQEIKDFTQKKETIKEFRKTIEQFIKEDNSQKPLVFFIDELDRCRPDYAVEFLEQMKHLFSVKGIVFVLSIDKNHLACSIRGFYGNENINTEEYLRRFIDLEYSIPNPSIKEFCKYLFEYYSFKDFFFAERRVSHRHLQGEADSFLIMAELLFNKSNSTLRQQEKIFGSARLILQSFKIDEPLFPYLLFFLIFIKTIKNDSYKKIEQGSIMLQDLSDLFNEIMSAETDYQHNLNLIYVEALILHFYNNNKGPYKEKLLINDDNGNQFCIVKSKLDVENSRYSLAACLNDIDNNFNYRDYNLNYFLKKISLLDPVYFF